MPYNTSRAVVTRNKRFLDDMLEGKRTLTWPAENPEQMARKIREALAAVMKYPDLQRYHDLKAFYRLRPGLAWVEAEYIGPPAGSDTYTPRSMQIPEATTYQHVVGACIKFGAKADELVFPNVHASDKELLALYEWGRSEEHVEWKLIFHDPGVTMTRRRQVDKLFLWRPPDGSEHQD